MNYEDLLQHLGGFGFFQMLMFFFLSYNTFLSGIEFQVLAVALFKQEYHCSAYNLTETNVTGKCSGACIKWNFSTEPMQATLFTDYELVCDRDYLIQVILNAHFIGRTLGALLGQLGDIYGRRPIMLLCIVGKFVSAFGIPFVKSLYGQLLFRFLDGFGALLMNLGLVMLTELVPLKQRGLVAMNYFTPWCVGYMMAALVTYYGQTWQTVYFITALMSLLYLPLFFILPESPRWLLVKGRHAEAKKVFQSIAWYNRTHMKESFLEDLKFSTDETHESFREFFVNPRLCIRLIVLTFGAWSLCMSYYGLSLDLNFASSSIFINIVLMGFMELPGGPISAFLGDRYGRKWTMFAFTCGTIVCILLVPALPLTGSLHWIRLTTACMGKFTLCVAFSLYDVLVTEIFPTSLRNMGFTVVGFFAGLAIVVTPYIMLLDKFNDFVTPTVIAVHLLITIVAVIIICPETMGLPLPDVVADVELLKVGEERAWATIMLAKKLSVENEMNENELEISDSEEMIAAK